MPWYPQQPAHGLDVRRAHEVPVEAEYAAVVPGSEPESATGGGRKSQGERGQHAHALETLWSRILHVDSMYTLEIAVEMFSIMLHVDSMYTLETLWRCGAEYCMRPCCFYDCPPLGPHLLTAWGVRLPSQIRHFNSHQ